QLVCILEYKPTASAISHTVGGYLFVCYSTLIKSIIASCRLESFVMIRTPRTKNLLTSVYHDKNGKANIRSKTLDKIIRSVIIKQEHKFSYKSGKDDEYVPWGF